MSCPMPTTPMILPAEQADDAMLLRMLSINYESIEHNSWQKSDELARSMTVTGE